MRYCLILLVFVLLSWGCQRKTGRPQGESTDNSSVRSEVIQPPATVVTESILTPGSAPRSAYPYQPYPTLDRRQPGSLPRVDNRCEFVGEVWDFSGLDGCGLLVETTTGHLFNVVSLPQGYTLKAGERIRFGFSYAENTVSSCQHEDAVIRITCMQRLRGSSGFARPFVCRPYDEKTNWIQDLIRDLRANYVTRFPWTGDRFAYLFETSDGQYLYDCRGFLLCQPKTNCLKFIEDFSLGKLIYEG